MKKKIVVAIVVMLFLLGGFIWFINPVINRKTINLDLDYHGFLPKSVINSNGGWSLVIDIADQPEYFYGKYGTLEKNPKYKEPEGIYLKNGSKKLKLRENDGYSLQGKFINKNNSIFLVGNICGGNGSMCQHPNTDVVLISNKKAEVYDIGKSPKSFQINTRLDGNKDLIVVDSPMYDDKYGNVVNHNLVYFEDIGFLDEKINKLFIPYIGKHSDKLFSDKNLVKEIAQASGLKEDFFKLRNALIKSYPINVYGGKFLVIHGYGYDDNFAVCIIDAVSGNVYWSMQENKINSYGGRNIPQYEKDYFDEMLYDMGIYGTSVSDFGRIILPINDDNE